MLLTQCVTAIVYGDKEVKGESLFLKNLINLKMDIGIEIRKINKLQNLFLAIDIMVVSPIIFLDEIREWAVKSFPVLGNFYYGEVGTLMLIGIFLATIILFMMVEYLEETNYEIKTNHDILKKMASIKFVSLGLDNYVKKNYGKLEKLREDLKRMGESITPRQLLVKRFLFGLISTILCAFAMLYIHKLNQDNYIHRVSNVDQISNSFTDQEDIKAAITEYVDRLKDKESIIKEELASELSGEIRSQTILNNVVDEIVTRAEKYQNEYLRWYEVLGVLVFGYLSYCFPVWMILFRRSVMKMNMNNEIIQFQSIILMLMYIDRITVPEILEYMECFSVIFRDSIRICLNEYDSGDIEALNNLRERETFQAFQKLVDNYLISDKIGIEKAFDEVAVDRVNFIEDRKQENELLVQSKGSTAQFIAEMFFLFILFIYLAIPFTTGALNMFSSYNSSIGY